MLYFLAVAVEIATRYDFSFRILAKSTLLTHILSGDEDDAGFVQLVIDVLQIVQNLVTLLALLAGTAKVHAHVLVLLNQVLQNLVGDLLDGGGVLLQLEPLQHFLLVHQVTLVDGWDFIFKVHQRRQMVQAVLAGLLGIIQAGDHDLFLLELVINVLQLVQHADVLLVVLVV